MLLYIFETFMTIIIVLMVILAVFMMIDRRLENGKRTANKDVHN